MTAVIPTIHIDAFMSTTATAEERQAVIDEVRDACNRYGFFNLLGHGISQETLTEIFNCNKMFFKLPEDQKMDVCISKSLGRSFRGYEPPGIQVHQEGLLPDIKEASDLIHFAPPCSTTDENTYPRHLWSGERYQRMTPTVAHFPQGQTSGRLFCQKNYSKTV